MDTESIRKHCLSLPGATEGIQWGNDLLFRVAGKIFVVVAFEMSPIRVSFKCTPEEFAQLIEREDIVPAAYMARNHWVSMLRPDALPAAEVKRLIRDSYGMVRTKLPKKVQAQLQ